MSCCGNIWTIDEILSIEREFELLELSVTENDATHEPIIYNLVLDDYLVDCLVDYYDNNQLDIEPENKYVSETYKEHHDIINKRLNNLEPKIKQLKETNIEELK